MKYSYFNVLAPPPGKVYNTAYFDKVFGDIDLPLHIKNVCLDYTDKKNAKYKARIDTEDTFYPAPVGEQDHKALLSKWNSQITANQILNKLVKPTDTVKTKIEIQNSLKQLKSNLDNFRISNGFNALSQTLGGDKVDILLKDKRLVDEQVKSYRERTPTYTERKKVLEAEWATKMKDTQHLIEKVSKTRKDILLTHKAKREEEKKRKELQQKKMEEKERKLEQEREKQRLEKAKELEDKRKKAEDEKEKQLLFLKEYNQKYIR